MPKNIFLPDGRTLSIPDDISPDKLAALKLKLGAKYPDFKTGVGVEQYAEEQARHPSRGVLSRPAMPGTSSHYAGPQSKALTPAQRESRAVPFEVAKVAAPAVLTAVAPEVAAPGVIASTIARGSGALAGASYGGKKAEEFGLPKWAGQLAGGTAGVFAPEVIGKISSPILSRLALLMGKSAPEAAATIAEDTSLSARVGRDVVERAARGQTLTPEEEELLLDQVQKHYTPESGVEESAKKAGKVYAGRGSKLRPTNEQIAIAKRTGVPPPPSVEPEVAYRARAVGENGIPKSGRPQATMDPAQAEQYAKNLSKMTGQPHEVATIDLSKTPHTKVPHPSGSTWVQFGEEQPETVVTGKSHPVKAEEFEF